MNCIINVLLIISKKNAKLCDFIIQIFTLQFIHLYFINSVVLKYKNMFKNIDNF